MLILNEKVVIRLHKEGSDSTVPVVQIAIVVIVRALQTTGTEPIELRIGGIDAVKPAH